jgi:ribosome maturation factor RimP
VTQAKAGPRAALIELLAPIVQASGADLEDVAVSKAGSRSVVRVVVDRDGGLDLDCVAEVSHAVSAALDAAEDLLKGSFVLEVTTPGVDRPLSEPRHWRRAEGRLVKVTRRTGGTVIARVSSAGADKVVLVDPASGVASDLAYSDVSRAVVQVEFVSHEGAAS